MSEYQYYEFQAVDQPLTAEQQRALRAISTRARISAWGFVNSYSYGELRAAPEKLLAAYFDIFVYVSSWGHRRLIIRLPRDLLPGAACEFEHPAALSLRTEGAYVFLEWSREADEDGEAWTDEEDWTDGKRDGTAWMSVLSKLRQELIGGDLRSLYLGWLSGIIDYEEAEECDPPAAPPGLDRLTAAQEALCRFLSIDPALLDVAAETSPPPPAPDRDRTAAAVRRMSPAEKDQWLLRLLAGEPWLQQRFARHLEEIAPAAIPDAPPPRRLLASEMVALAAERAAEEERKAQEAALRQREQALDALERRQEAVWAGIADLISKQQAKAYDQAVQHLTELRELSVRRGNVAAFQRRLDALLSGHHRRRSLIERIRAAGLSTNL